MGYTETKVLIGGIAHIPVLISLFALVDRRYGKKYFLQKLSEEKAIAEAKAMAEAEAAKAVAYSSNEEMEIQSSAIDKKIESSSEGQVLPDPKISISGTNEETENK
tara:strand:- start:3831 stop:4148 length:318 start_codon:yes stop_codon:yes gene_type:complete